MISLAQTKCKTTLVRANIEEGPIGACFICCQTYFSCFTKEYVSFKMHVLQMWDPLEENLNEILTLTS